ncbi:MULTISPECIES: ATP-binding cassette domain-containing protein [unclassified Bradyrhizobium]|uniref:ATP-binding cassette domain-containing protein n=1 Tax=unclassified Bradyrhizobium TaxID=2631580 RepID=UPI001BA475CA|nr:MULTISPECIES: ATP-binding cassette domain-containing protein [unclassified Bradyrhizobium]MBR1227109.1 ABC transporter ATP-binding protein [Bradyrhizobium sp. AUGA SZCCT0176]MBR1237153.1 ABC transporter ATP-binding protein [Bradyrhizobium sp. AUGA SZCCT0182]MBR1296501.1 ABC transporter ATP-binding protein [Bradyrhizobium sp. AUGA SZCCT0042]
MSGPLLSISDLHVHFAQRSARVFRALNGVSFDVMAGETVGLVGESGSGKTTIGRVILGLAPATSGRVMFDGEDITHASRRRRRDLAREIQVVFQDPYGSLNPTRTIGDTLAEPLLMDRALSRTERDARISDVLNRVGMPTDAATRYPAQFSGGQRQRIAIARAVIARPRLVVCDEPVSALDLSVQAQVLNLLSELQKSMGLSLLFISHDLTVVRHVSHRTVVLYKGEIVEHGDSQAVHEAPQHSYTRALLSAAPVPNPKEQRQRREAWRRQKEMIASEAGGNHL